MKVKSVELINLKSHERSKLELSENINLIVGANNSGKSVIIKSLLNLQYSNIFEVKDIRATFYYSKIFIELVDVNKTENNLFIFKTPKNEFKESDKFTIGWGIRNNGTTETFRYY